MRSFALDDHARIPVVMMILSFYSLQRNGWILGVPTDPRRTPVEVLVLFHDQRQEKDVLLH